jgi:PHD/YefM family antitoxin component YafN of YafNO toxin-antitoxin module
MVCLLDIIALNSYNMVRILQQGVDDMLIKPSAAIRQNYNEIAVLCRSSQEPVFLTKNGEGDLVVMDMDTYSRREKMLRLREELLTVEEDRAAGRVGVTPDELDSYLENIIDEVERGAV